MMIAICLVFWFNNRYIKIADKAGGIAPPEARLHMAMLGGVLLPIGVGLLLPVLKEFTKY